MSGRFNEIQSVSKNTEGERNNMLDLWRASIDRVVAERRTVQTPAKSEDEARADLEQKVRNGEIQCKTCAMRQYKDESGDTAVSFQAPKHISAASAGVSVSAHEGEHVSAESSRARAEGGRAGSAVTLEYAKCPECGRTYVKGGVTVTTITRPADKKMGRIVDTRA